jgi:transketolase
MGKGVPFLEQREKNHFIRVDPPEWQQALQLLDASQGEGARHEQAHRSDRRQEAALTTSAMIASIAAEGQRVKAAPFGKALVDYAASRPEIVGLTADLAKYTDLHLFAQAYPERFHQMGMAEQLLMGAAGGMAKEGLVPFATTYAVFGTRRAYDFIHQVIAEENLNVKICCALPGLTTGYGPSHQATEDLAMMRGVPGLTIVDPCDALDIEQAVPQIAAHPGPVYMRLLRGQVPLVLDEIDGYRFELGKAKLLRDGADVLVISSGLLTMRALEVRTGPGRMTGSAWPCCTARPSSRWTRPPSSRPCATATGWWWWPRTTRCRRSGRGGGQRADASPRAAGRVPAGGPARRLPRRRGLAHAARPLRHQPRALAGRIKGWLA